MTLENQHIIKEQKAQFENELFFKYLPYFTKIKIEYTEKLAVKFFDKRNLILNIPKNPTFEEIKKIIKTLDKYTGYDLGITAKKRLITYSKKIKQGTIKDKTGLKLIGFKNIDNLENSLLRESLYEQGKKYILKNMKAPNSNELLKDKINLEKLSENFKKLSLSEIKKIINGILWTLSYYPDANTSKNNGGIPLKFVENKKLYCIGYSYLADIIFEKLGIKHSVATGIKLNNKNKNPHSVSIIKIDNKNYIFDPTALLTGTFFLKEIKIENKSFKFKDYSFTIGNPETEILAQNIWNLSQDKQIKNEKIKMLKYGLKLSPNNILIKKSLKELCLKNL